LNLSHAAELLMSKELLFLLNSLPKFHLNSIALQSYLSLFMQCCRCFHPSDL
jgi:hypothetical protein